MTIMNPPKRATLCVGELPLSSAQPTIIVPISGHDAQHSLAQARRAAHTPAGLIEWRVDALKAYENLATIAAEIREIIARPLIATVRTTAQGGAYAGDADSYLGLIKTLANLPSVDLVDVEYTHPLAAQAIEAVHMRGTAIIGSHHEFHTTPSTGEMIAHLEAEENLGADICKLAVMPADMADTARLLQATAERSTTSNKPLITIAMGRLGLVSRLIGHEFGSVASFAALDGNTTSAPGQPQAEKLTALYTLLEQL